MTIFIVLIGLGVLAALIAVPFLLPWQNYLRWLIAIAAVPDPWGMTSTPWSDLEEVTLERVPGQAGLLVVRLAGSPTDPRPLLVEGTAASATSLLECWAVAGVPLLKVAAVGGGFTLCGPTCSVAGLRFASDRSGPARDAPDYVGTPPALSA